MRGVNELGVVVGKDGRRFAAGKPLENVPGVSVARITRVGNYVTVGFGPSANSPSAGRVPPAMTMHTDDVRHMAGLA